MVGEPNFFSMTTLRPLGTERDFNRVGQNVDAAQNSLARLLAVNDLLCHLFLLLKRFASLGRCGPKSFLAIGY